MDFFLWGEMKHLVYDTLSYTKEELVDRVAAAAMVIFQTPDIFNAPDNHWYADATFVFKSMASNFNN